MKQLLFKIWIIVGRLGYFFGRLPIALLIRNSRRTRVLLVHGDEYLLVRHWLGDGRWMLPGGGCHRGEEPLQAAQREIREELGIIVSSELWHHAGRHECRDDGFRFSYDLYIVPLTARPQLKLQKIEISHAKWFDQTDTSPVKACPELAVALERWSALD